MKCAETALLLAISALSVGLPVVNQTAVEATKAAPEVWGAPVHGLQMSISLVSSVATSVPEITLHVRNVGAGLQTVYLGGGCGAARPTNVVLILTDSSGKHKQLRDLGAGTWFCAGVGVSLSVHLAVGAEYTIPLILEYYREFPVAPAPQGNDFARGWEPGNVYTLQAELTDQPHERDWEGTLNSNELKVRFPPSSEKAHQ